MKAGEEQHHAEKRLEQHRKRDLRVREVLDIPDRSCTQIDTRAREKGSVREQNGVRGVSGTTTIGAWYRAVAWGCRTGIGGCNRSQARVGAGNGGDSV